MDGEFSRSFSAETNLDAELCNPLILDLRTLEDEQGFGTIASGGRMIPIIANGSMSGLVPIARANRPVLEVRTDADIPFPPAVGETVGSVTVTIGDSRIGSVPLIVKSVPGPRPLPSGHWWTRTLGAAVHAVTGILHAIFG